MAELALRALDCGILCLDRLGILLAANPTALRLLVAQEQAVLGRPLCEAFKLIEPDGTPVALTWDSDHLDKHEPLPPGACVRDGLGRLIAVSGSISPLVDDQRTAIGAVISFRDATDERARTSLLTHRATHDALTGLPIRWLLQDRMRHAVARAKRQVSQIAVLALDLDGFKAVNDLYGHSYGDQVLADVARFLGLRKREADTFGRLGGDEFVLIQQDVTDRSEPAVLAERMIDTLIAWARKQPKTLQLGLSVGIAFYPIHGDGPDQLLKAADKALYEAKRSGGCAYRVAES
ncbi:MAG: diguanylate cyclase domain-containing protein [Geminicoccaceae bacterium]